jgi:hypothetical protein
MLTKSYRYGQRTRLVEPPIAGGKRPSDNIAERVLGHAIAGVEGVYNRFDYAAEKAEALDRLARLIDRIVNPPDRSNVVAGAFPRARLEAGDTNQ